MSELACLMVFTACILFSDLSSQQLQFRCIIPTAQSPQLYDIKALFNHNSVTQHNQEELSRKNVRTKSANITSVTYFIMKSDVRQNSLQNLAHIANMSQELQALNEALKKERQDDIENHYSNGLHGTPSNAKSGRKKMACVECRQQKSRCDAHERHPHPCTRCTKKGLQCDLKSDYKRTYKRARIAQIEKEVAELRKTLTSEQASELLSKIPSLATYDSSHDGTPQPNTRPATDQYPSAAPEHRNSSETNPSSIPNTPSINRIPEPGSFSDIHRTTIPDYLLHCEEKTLDDVKLSPEMIRSLYLEYVKYYHPILPVVDVMKGPEKVYKLCPALFWVIMVVALRREPDPNQKGLLLQLSPIIKDVLAEITISPITRYNPTEEDEPILNACSVYSVQAFLIYTYWPPITSSLSADSSWNTIGLALFHAIRIGLNSPNAVIADPNSSKTPQQVSMAYEQMKTWILCNIVSQTIATAFGFPAFVQLDTSIWSAMRPSSPIQIPKSIKFMLEIAQFEDQASKTLNSNPLDPYGLIDPTERLPLLKVLASQLDELELRMTDELAGDSYRRFQLLMVRVHLLTYYFMDSSRLAFFELQKGLVRLYNASIALINYAHVCQIKDKTFIKYLPSVYVLNVWQASCIIAKLSHSSMKKFIDLGSGKQSYQAAISLAAKASILKHDVAHRSSGIMRNMWQVLRTLDENKMTSLTIGTRSRMSSSVFFDCLHVLRDQVGMIKLNSRNDSNQDDAEVEEAEEGGSNEDDEEYGFQDNEAVVESGDEKVNDASQKSTPSSNASSKTRKTRSLSNTVNAESKARKIIRTIPLDPQPIVAGGKRNPTLKSSSTEASPNVKKEHSSSPDVPRSQAMGQTHFRITPLHSPLGFSNSPKTTGVSSRMALTGNIINRSVAPHKAPQVPDLDHTSTQFTQRYQANGNVDDMREMHNIVLNDSPLQGGLENLEMDTIDINSDLLWKDVDSVMNDFGFHAA